MSMRRAPSTLWHTLLSSLRSDNGRLASAPALISPQQGIRWTYQELQAKVCGLSRGLQDDRGVTVGDVVATDLPNVAEGLVLQLACSRLGASVATAKNATALQKNVPSVRCVVVVGDEGASWLSEESFQTPHLVAGQDEMNSMLDLGGDGNTDLDDDKDEYASDRPLGYFGSGTPLSHATALQQGLDMKNHLYMTDADKVCVSITLYHAFGIGSACSSSLQSGAAIVLPAVGGLQGCGIPSQRATVTLNTLVDEECSLLFADTHTLKAFHDDSLAEHFEKSNLSSFLRGGVCKIGSGTEILAETVDLAGVSLSTLGKK